MLPIHFLDPTKKRNERPNHTRLGQAPPPPLPSLCVTGAMSQIGRFQILGTTSTNDDQQQQQQQQQQQDDPIILSYIIFRPRQLHDSKKAPLVCLHGGPSIPSNYLLPIVNGVTDRAVIFYDQWGCGKSSRPKPVIIKRVELSKTNSPTVTNTDDNDSDDDGTKSSSLLSSASLQRQQSSSEPSSVSSSVLPPFSIPIMVEHLHQLVTKCWKIQKFHLLGHSFGGILAFEYLKQQQQQQQLQRQQSQGLMDATTTASLSSLSMSVSHPKIMSLTLSSTPTSAMLVQIESKRLYHNLRVLQCNRNSSSSSNDKKNVNETDDDDDDDNDDDDDDNNNKKGIHSNSHDTDSDTDTTTDINKPDIEGFQQTFECRLSQPPLALTDAIAQAGPTEWRGIPAIADYVATGTIYSGSVIPTLLLRGEYDFCTELCMEGWKDRIVGGGQPDEESTTSSLPSSSLCSSLEKKEGRGEDHHRLDRVVKKDIIQTKVLSNCSHYAMLEDERQYGKAVLDFIQEHDIL
jgi:pimeloyl-ACP methyl ester carboxylesterase